MRFQKGQSGNPTGRPKGSKTKFSIVELEKAIKEVEEKKKISIFKHLIERAFVSDTVLIALMKKLLPDSQNNSNQIDQELFEHEIEICPPISKEEALEKYKRFYS